MSDRDSAFELEPEDIARVGQRNQNRKNSALSRVNKGLQTLLDARRKQDRCVYSIIQAPNSPFVSRWADYWGGGGAENAFSQ